MEFTLSQVSLPCDVEVEATGPLFSPTLCSFLKLCSLSLLLLLIAFGDITRFEREREGDVEEVTLPNLGLGLVQNS